MKILVFLVLLIIMLTLLSFISASYPIFKATCVNAAASRAVNIVNSQIEDTMQNYTYNDLIDIEKDDNGNVVLMKLNTVLMNQISSQISSKIQRQIDNAPTTMVYMNYGSISGMSILKNFGLSFEVELESAGSIDTQIKSEFESAGVNQTLHKIYLDINTRISILTPIGSYAKEITPKVLLTEAIIVGNVPENYYNLEGLNSGDSLEFIQ